MRALTAGEKLLRIGFSLLKGPGRVWHFYRGPEHVELHIELVNKQWHVCGTRYMPSDAPAELRALDVESGSGKIS